MDLVKCCHRFICQHDALPPGEIMSKRVKIHGKTVVFLGPLEFRNLFYRKPRLRWLIDYAKHVMLGYYHHFGRMPDNRELVDIMSKLVRYRCKIFSTSDLGGTCYFLLNVVIGSNLTLPMSRYTMILLFSFECCLVMLIVTAVPLGIQLAIFF